MGFTLFFKDPITFYHFDSYKIKYASSAFPKGQELIMLERHQTIGNIDFKGVLYKSHLIQFQWLSRHFHCRIRYEFEMNKTLINKDSVSGSIFKITDGSQPKK